MDPTALVPGNPVSVIHAATTMRSYGDALQRAGRGLARITVAEGWTGDAGDAFRRIFGGQPDRWIGAGESFHTAADALVAYADALRWAQDQTSVAVAEWIAAEAATAGAASHLQPDDQRSFHDPGEVGRHRAQAILNTAHALLAKAGETATRAVAAARDRAPPTPTAWDVAGVLLKDVGAGLQNTAGHLVNGLASLGNAAIHHPGDTATMLAGIGLMVVAGTADAGGVALDATGVGAVAGVPINIVATGGVAAGGALAAIGTRGLMMHASRDDHVSPIDTDHVGAESGFQPVEGFRGREFSKDEIVEFVNGHTGDANPVLGRPGSAEVEEALTKGIPQQLEGRNAERFDHNGVRVIVNYDMPWRSTSYHIGR
jgi:hypothetical protein